MGPQWLTRGKPYGATSVVEVECLGRWVEQGRCTTLLTASLLPEKLNLLPVNQVNLTISSNTIRFLKIVIYPIRSLMTEVMDSVQAQSSQQMRLFEAATLAV
jgi:hypothetical protein